MGNGSCPLTLYLSVILSTDQPCFTLRNLPLLIAWTRVGFEYP